MTYITNSNMNYVPWRLQNMKYEEISRTSPLTLNVMGLFFFYL